MTSDDAAFVLMVLSTPSVLYGAVVFVVWYRRHADTGSERHSYAWPRPQPEAPDQPPTSLYVASATAAILLFISSMVRLLG